MIDRENILYRINALPNYFASVRSILKDLISLEKYIEAKKLLESCEQTVEDKRKFSVTFDHVPADKIIGVVPEECNGPGWSNQLLWVYWIGDNQQILQYALQPEEWNSSTALVSLFKIGSTVHLELLRAVQQLRNSKDDSRTIK